MLCSQLQSQPSRLLYSICDAAPPADSHNRLVKYFQHPTAQVSQLPRGKKPAHLLLTSSVLVFQFSMFFSVWVPRYLHFCLMLRIQKSGVAILFLPCEITTISLAFVTFSNRFTDLLSRFLPPVHHLYIQWMHSHQTTLLDSSFTGSLRYSGDGGHFCSNYLFLSQWPE